LPCGKMLKISIKIQKPPKKPKQKVVPPKPVVKEETKCGSLLNAFILAC